jgi:hypothetical protein
LITIKEKQRLMKYKLSTHLNYQKLRGLFPMAAYNPLAFGHALRIHRLKLGWSASTLSELYAEFVGREDSPPDPTFIYHLERGTTLLCQQRRAILASLVGMPLALVGIAELDHSTPLDLPEYIQALEWYCDKWHNGPIKQERGAIQERTNRLEAAALQAFGAEKRTLLELFGFYQLLHADAWGGEQQLAMASSLLSSTIERAKESQFSALLVLALTQRGLLPIARFETTLNRDFLQAASRDYNEALKEQSRLPALYAGLLLVRRGLLDAYTACDKQAFTAALHQIAKGSKHIGASPDDKRITARLDEECCMLTRARAYLHSPMGDAKLGLAQLQELELEHPEPRGKRRLVHRNQLWASAYLATGDYPMSAAHLEAAVENASEECIDHLVSLHTRLKNTSYGKNPDIGRVAVKIHQIKYPELFL